MLLLQTSLPWCLSELEELQHQLQALVALAQRQVNIGTDSAQGVEQRREQQLQGVSDVCTRPTVLYVNTQQNRPG